MIIAKQELDNAPRVSPNQSFSEHTSANTMLFIWLTLCCTFVLTMILIGAITRLTESGLSIVEWKIVTGMLPPIGTEQWQAEFEQYKTSPEFLKKNFWMGIEDFRKIYFWEWLHRLLGRLIGLLYALPFLYFLQKSMIPKGYRIKIGGLVVLVGLQGLMGWYMVKSGLIDQPAVSHYRLAAHLTLALLLYALTLWYALTFRESGKSKSDKTTSARLYRLCCGALALLSITIIWGAFTAGLDAGLVYNETFPMMGNSWIPIELSNAPTISGGLTETHAGVQFAHRWLAMLTGTYIIAFALYAMIKQKRSEKSFHVLLAIVICQISLGIWTLFSGVHILPATLHQAGAVILLSTLVIKLHTLKPQREQPLPG